MASGRFINYVNRSSPLVNRPSADWAPPFSTGLFAPQGYPPRRSSALPAAPFAPRRHAPAFPSLGLDEVQLPPAWRREPRATRPSAHRSPRTIRFPDPSWLEDERDPDPAVHDKYDSSRDHYWLPEVSYDEVQLPPAWARPVAAGDPGDLGPLPSVSPSEVQLSPAWARHSDLGWASKGHRSIHFPDREWLGPGPG